MVKLPMLNTSAARPRVTLAARARLPSRFGDFTVIALETEDGEYGVVARGDLEGAEAVPVRLHSECFTGDVMGSLKCDCRDQLEFALRFIGRTDVHHNFCFCFGYF